MTISAVIGDVMAKNKFIILQFFFSKYIVLRTPEVANSADINEKAIMLIKKIKGGHENQKICIRMQFLPYFSRYENC